jgi:hypothetical protein
MARAHTSDFITPPPRAALRDGRLGNNPLSTGNGAPGFAAAGFGRISSDDPRKDETERRK